ncbi:hypothetical protein KKF91_07005 [Myxococcota bacterium]|nr:hypothetical protein [Myxococcota bacterium]MBU1896626.1 hypothetical protein [Myxococcota bacterium]
MISADIDAFKLRIPLSMGYANIGQINDLNKPQTLILLAHKAQGCTKISFEGEEVRLHLLSVVWYLHAEVGFGRSRTQEQQRQEQTSHRRRVLSPNPRGGAREKSTAAAFKF